VKLLVITSYRDGGATNGLKRFVKLFDEAEVTFAYLEDYFTPKNKMTIKLSNGIMRRILRTNDLISTGITFTKINFANLVAKSDVVLLGWIADGFWGISDYLIGKKIIWRFSDLWPVLKYRHYLTSSLLKNFQKQVSYEKVKFIINNNVRVVIPSPDNIMFVRRVNIDAKNIYIIYTPIEDKFFKEDFQVNNPKSQVEVVYGAYNYLTDDRKGFKDLEHLISNSDPTKFIFHLFGDKDKTSDKRDNVTCHGIISPEERTKLLMRSDVCIVPSMQDNLPQVGIEAICAGCVLYAREGIGFDTISTQHKLVRLFKDRDALLADMCDLKIERILNGNQGRAKREGSALFRKSAIQSSAEFKRLLGDL
jgi:hypothetical protein